MIDKSADKCLNIATDRAWDSDAAIKHRRSHFTDRPRHSSGKRGARSPRLYYYVEVFVVSIAAAHMVFNLHY